MSRVMTERYPTTEHKHHKVIIEAADSLDRSAEVMKQAYDELAYAGVDITRVVNLLQMSSDMRMHARFLRETQAKRETN